MNGIQIVSIGLCVRQGNQPPLVAPWLAPWPLTPDRMIQSRALLLSSHGLDLWTLLRLLTSPTSFSIMGGSWFEYQPQHGLEVFMVFLSSFRRMLGYITTASHQSVSMIALNNLTLNQALQNNQKYKEK